MTDAIVDFFKDHTFNFIVIFGFALFSWKFLILFIQRLIRRALRRQDFPTARDEKLREDTLISIVDAVIKIMIWIIVALLILSEIGIDIAPLLASAGIAGVALGFGAQSMVKDFLSGGFILLENQYRVGDVIQINRDVSGKVEQVTLRATVLRDLDGMVHHIPNGVIEIATNMTMDYANVNLDIDVGYDTDIDALEKIINKVGTDLANHDKWGKDIKEAPQFRRIQEFGESAIVVKIVGKTEPVKQWAVTGELRRRLKKAFDKEGIEIPFPQRVMHEAKKAKRK